MHRAPSGYVGATRHPWSSLLFLLPLLICYEVGVFWLGGERQEAVRNGADTWLRWGLEAFGLTQFYGAPALIVAVFLAWSWLRWRDRPEHAIAVCLGMALESAAFAVGLWALSQNLNPWLDQLGIRLSFGPPSKRLGLIVTFVGAGIYEEVLFRFLLFLALGCVLRLVGLGGLMAAILTTLLSALVFSAAHHLGPYGETFNRYVFFFRALAGLYFALLYQLRGFGVAVGAHACYDVLAGVLMV